MPTIIKTLFYDFMIFLYVSFLFLDSFSSLNNLNCYKDLLTICNKKSAFIFLIFIFIFNEQKFVMLRCWHNEEVLYYNFCFNSFEYKILMRNTSIDYCVPFSFLYLYQTLMSTLIRSVENINDTVLNEI